MLLLSSLAWAQEPACVPDCREGFVCVQGACVSACNPPCPAGQSCTADARCVGAAAPPPPPLAPAPAVEDRGAYWRRVDRRAQTVYRAGVITGISGIALGTVGSLLGDYDLLVIGGLGEVVGLPMMAGGSLRSRRALQELGGEVSPVAGGLGWGLWGASLAGSVAYYGTWESEPDLALGIYLGSAAARVGGYVAAAVQHGANEKGRRTLGVAHLEVIPLVSPDSVGVVWVAR